MEGGLISPTEFLSQAEAFCGISDLIKDGWILERVGSDEAMVYLVKKQSQILDIGSRANFIDSDSNDTLESKDFMTSGADDVVEDMELWENSIEHDDASIETTNTETSVKETHVNKPCITCEYHVVYSASFSVPVLYFNMYAPSGKLLSLVELWSSIPHYYQSRLQDERWTFITQQEHPLLGRPFFYLHPCHTANLMAAVPSGNGNEVDNSYGSDKGNGSDTTKIGASAGNESDSEKCSYDRHSSTSDMGDKDTENTDVAKKLGLHLSKQTFNETIHKQLNDYRLRCKYLVSWLSTVGPVVHLPLPLKYAG